MGSGARPQETANEAVRLVRGGEEDPLLPRLLAAIRRADEIELAVAFIKSSGLSYLFDALVDQLERQSPARVRIVTSDYLGVTDPQALRQLLLLAERGAEVRVFEAKERSFHLKAYLFTRGAGSQGEAFIGSSNISREALTQGLEWNYRVDAGCLNSGGPQRLAEIRDAFWQIFQHPRTRALDYNWVDEYERRRPITPPSVAPGSDDPELPPPDPTPQQQEALEQLSATRAEGHQRGLAVMATGLGKTYLAAFDARQLDARRILFIAHREEILLQAEATFQRVFPQAHVGRYRNQERNGDAAMLFASVQTLHRDEHLERFPADAFDYVVVDEFHHAAANTYRRLLHHFQPRFLLGLTATPERADQANILTLCDDNLVYTADLFDGIRAGRLCPFHYYGIHDEQVDYQAIPWRNGRFDEQALEHRFATEARARHNLREWRDKAGQWTLAFCASQRHADFMANYFQRNGVSALSVHTGSTVTREEAIERLRQGSVQVVFSVDLFSEGVDVPLVDTVMMLRPTESPVLFLQQLGRGLRIAPGKSRLVVLDFIGNHRAFLNRPQALFGTTTDGAALRELAQKARDGRLELPPGCFVNYDLAFIDFLERFAPRSVHEAFENLEAGLGRRPTATEAYRAGLSMPALRREGGSWWGFLHLRGELDSPEIRCVGEHADFLREVETTRLNKSYKMVLLEALLELDGFREPVTVEALVTASAAVFRRRPELQVDLPEEMRGWDGPDPDVLRPYWEKNPIYYWCRSDRGPEVQRWFVRDGDDFRPTFRLDGAVAVETFTAMVQELVDYRLAQYQPAVEGLAGKDSSGASGSVIPFPRRDASTELPFYPDLRIACGHFRTGRGDSQEWLALPPGHGRLDPERHFVARAVGHSMDGGRQPIRDGDYLLLEWVTDTSAGSITGTTMAIESQDTAGDDQYLLRVVRKADDGRYILRANNPEYPDLEADDTMRTFARVRAVLEPLEVAVGQSFQRQEIPPLFGAEYSAGAWQSGHVVLPDSRTHILLVTLNKQGKAADHRYLDYFIDDRTFHWQSQNQTTPESKRGQELIEHRQRGIDVHLFVRDRKLGPDGRAAPFRYMGPVVYLRHEGSAPMSVTFQLQD